MNDWFYPLLALLFLLALITGVMWFRDYMGWSYQCASNCTHWTQGGCYYYSSDGQPIKVTEYWNGTQLVKLKGCK